MVDPATASAKAAEAIAKTTGQAVEIIRDTGSYLRGVFGEVPTDLVGVLGGAWLHERHQQLRDALRRRTEQILRERDVQEEIELSPNVAAALIAGAQEEGREELMELWARLLANAMDPNMNSIRHSFIASVKNMDPMDAILLRYIHERNIASVYLGHRQDNKLITGTEEIAAEIGRRGDEVEVSLRHLQDLLFFDYANHVWDVSATGREFLRACYPEVITAQKENRVSPIRHEI
jgi:hypothetical protein